MIGVAAGSDERPIVEEFFQLFKTPWEFYREGATYDVLVSTADEPVDSATKVILFYNGRKTAADETGALVHRSEPDGSLFGFGAGSLPIYGPHVTFDSCDRGMLTNRASGRAAIQSRRTSDATQIRIGYNLFEEINLLLTKGQPAAHARIPALELHIALLRNLILDAGLPLVEIPPSPADYEFMVCLTHDIDHPLARNHRFDNTAWGFFYRATLGTFVNVITGRSRIKDLGRNLAAAIRFPLSQWGLCTDPWKNFSRYAEIEAGLGATYFVIPFADRPGRRRTGAAPAKRAARYTVEEVKPELDRASQAGCEIALHGIDAWFDAKSASVERARVAAAGLARPEGVRMHWLYFDSESPQSLDDSGFTYDSTFGYNATVGYRAGTLQVFRPPGVLKLLELPLHVMDTALFYPSYLHLRKAEAHLVLAGMIQQAAGFGGVLTFNWHDRSIAPERLWEEFYTETLRKLQARKTWFPTASKAVAWFQKRRSARIACDATRAGMLRVLASAEDDGTLPALTVRIHRPRAPGSRHAGDSALAHPFTDVKLEQQLDLEISL